MDIYLWILIIKAICIIICIAVSYNFIKGVLNATQRSEDDPSAYLESSLTTKYKYWLITIAVTALIVKLLAASCEASLK